MRLYSLLKIATNGREIVSDINIKEEGPTKEVTGSEDLAFTS